MTVFRAISVQLTTIYLRILFYHLIYTIFSPFSNHKLRGQVHAECAPNRAGCEGRGAPSGMTRDEVIETNERLRSLRLRLEESYETAKKALINLMNKYGDSKSQRNIFQRYPMLKLMIKVSKKGVINPPFKKLMLYI